MLRFGEVWLSQALLPVAMVEVAGGLLAVRSWGANLVPSVRKRVQQAWAAWLVTLLLLVLDESILFEATLPKLLLRWDGVTAHAVFDGLVSAMPPEEEGYRHQWKRDKVITALRDHNKLFAAGNLFWGGNPLRNLTAAAELLCWKEAAISVFGCVTEPAPVTAALLSEFDMSRSLGAEASG